MEQIETTGFQSTVLFLNYSVNELLSADDYRNWACSVLAKTKMFCCRKY